jgi:hypothetical protein
VCRAKKFGSCGIHSCRLDGTIDRSQIGDEGLAYLMHGVQCSREGRDIQERDLIIGENEFMEGSVVLCPIENRRVGKVVLCFCVPAISRSGDASIPKDAFLR